jgi:hypothetical protein
MVKKNANVKQNSEIKKKNRNRIQAVKMTLRNQLMSKKSEITDEVHKEKNYSDYITNIFNSRIIYMLIVYMNKNKEKLKIYKYDIEPNFFNKFIHLIKELNLNEIEVAFMTLLLDKLDWTFNNIDHWTYFYLLGIYTKKIVTGEDASDDFLSSKEEIRDKYATFVYDDTVEELENNKIKTQEINMRYKELNKPINSYCRKNFINYTSVADKIVRLSQPYGEESIGNQLFIEENENEIKKNEVKEKKCNNYLFDNLNLPLNSIIPYGPLSMIGNDTTFKRKMKSIIGYNKNYESSKPFTNLDMPPGGSQLSLNKQNSYSSFISNNSNNNNY